MGHLTDLRKLEEELRKFGTGIPELDSELLKLNAGNWGIAGVCEEQSLEMDAQDGAPPLSEVTLQCTGHLPWRRKLGVYETRQQARQRVQTLVKCYPGHNLTQVRPLPVSGHGWKLRRDRLIPWRPSSFVGTQAKTVHSGAWRVIRGAVKAPKMELEAD